MSVSAPESYSVVTENDATSCSCPLCRQPSETEEQAGERPTCPDCDEELSDRSRYECCGETRCSYCQDEHYEEYHAEPEDYDYRGWEAIRSDDNYVDGVWLRTTRTVGAEFEMDYGDGVRGLPPEVGYSLHCDADIEARTPPASGLAADRVNIDTLTTLVGLGYSSGEDTGLHVHIHFPEAVLSSTARNRFIALWAAIEDVAYLFDPDRRHSSWSRSWFYTSEYYYDKDAVAPPNKVVAQATKAALAVEWFDFYPGHDTSANMDTPFRTIEFRCHHATTDVQHVMAWMAFLQGVVDLSQRMGLSAPRRLLKHGTTEERAEALLRLAKRYKVFTERAEAGIREVVAPVTVPTYVYERELVAA